MATDEAVLLSLCADPIDMRDGQPVTKAVSPGCAKDLLLAQLAVLVGTSEAGVASLCASGVVVGVDPTQEPWVFDEDVLAQLRHAVRRRG